MVNKSLKAQTMANSFFVFVSMSSLFSNKLILGIHPIFVTNFVVTTCDPHGRDACSWKWQLERTRSWKVLSWNCVLDLYVTDLTM